MKTDEELKALYQQQDEERRRELKALYQKQQRQKLHLAAQRAAHIPPLPPRTAASKASGTSGDTMDRPLSPILEALSPAATSISGSHTTIYVLILLYMCPHTTIYVSSLILLDFRAGIWVMAPLCNGCNGRARVRLGLRGLLAGAAPLLSKEVVK
jgi:hypothetical protein